MASERAIEIRVGLFVLVALVIGSIMVFAIGNANQQFDKQVTIFSAFENVSGLKEGSLVSLSGLKIGVVDQVWFEQRKKLPGWLLDKQTASWRDFWCRKSEAKKQADLEAKAAQDGKLDPSGPRARLEVAIQRCLDSKISPEQIKEASGLSPYMIFVRMKVIQSALPRIRQDSVATVKGKGLLGDSLVDISMGTKGDLIQIGQYVEGITPKGLSDLMEEGGSIVTTLKSSLDSIDSILKQYRDPELSQNLKGIVVSINNVLERAKTGPGLIHDLMYSNRLTQNVQGILGQTQRTVRGVADTTAQAEKFLRQTQKPGTLLHSLLLAKRGEALVSDVQKIVQTTSHAMTSLTAILRSPQKEGTFLHKLLYTRESGEILSNLNKTSEDVRTILRDIRLGKGSLGALINDPTAFEDFKTILGQVKRSRIFRTLIRFVIQKDDSSKGGVILNKD